MKRPLLCCLFLFVSVPLLAAEPAESDIAVAIEGTAKVDGEVEAIWKDAPQVRVDKPIAGLLVIDQEKMATATVQLMWDENHLYALWHVKDAALSATASDSWAQDSVELFLDQNQKRTSYYESDDAQYRVSFEGNRSGQGTGYDENDLAAAAVKTDDGYRVEMSVRLSDIELKSGAKLGLELQVNDDHDSGSRDAVAKWHHTEDDSWENTSNFGTLELR